MTTFWAVDNRCAINLKTLKMHVLDEEIIALLQKLDFGIIQVNPILLARLYIGKVVYQRGALYSQAPKTVDCSSFIKWVFGQCGIWLPRRTIQQFQRGKQVNLDKVVAGDLIFASGFRNYYLQNPKEGIGHVGIYTGEDTVIHAVNKKRGVIESPLSAFTKNNRFRGVKRIIPKNAKFLTLLIPPHREAENSDDIKWIILQALAPKPTK